jgi:hypothetical protein
MIRRTSNVVKPRRVVIMEGEDEGAMHGVEKEKALQRELCLGIRPWFKVRQVRRLVKHQLQPELETPPPKCLLLY